MDLKNVNDTNLEYEATKAMERMVNTQRGSKYNSSVSSKANFSNEIALRSPKYQ